MNPNLDIINIEAVTVSVYQDIFLNIDNIIQDENIKNILDSNKILNKLDPENILSLQDRYARAMTLAYMAGLLANSPTIYK
jgi:hypothetical protein